MLCVLSKLTPTRYRPLNGSSCNAPLRGPLTVWFNPGMTRHAAPSVKRGRQQTFSDPAIQACLTINGLFGLVDIDAPSVRRLHRQHP